MTLSQITSEESVILLEVEDDELAPHADRLLASKVLYSLAESKLAAINRLVIKHKAIYLKLEHEHQSDKYLNDMAKKVESMADPEVMEQLLKNMLLKAEARKLGSK